MAGPITAFWGGAAYSIRQHGDWLLLRSPDGRCEAYDPIKGQVIDTWGNPNPTVCHMSDFIWARVF